MRLDVRVPAGRLREAVSQLWYWQEFAKPHALERLMPNGETTLVVNLHEDAVRVYESASLRLNAALSGAVLVGAHCEPMVIDSEEQKHVFGIQFRSGAAHAFFRPPLHEFANAHVEIDDLWCGAELRIRLLECVGDTEAIFDLAERLLAAQWIEQRCVHPAVRYAVREMARSSRPVIELVDATGLSSRRFIQLFKEQVGLTPKVFGRLQRFQRALRLADETGSAVDWSLLALNCGYYDQSHLYRDFREFAGISPELYRCTANKNQNHVPIE